MSKVTLNNGVEAWSFSSSQYVQAAVKNVEEYLSKEGRKLPGELLLLLLLITDQRLILVLNCVIPKPHTLWR